MFNETKYRNCIKQLKGIKVIIVILSILIFFFLGIGVGFAAKKYLYNENYIILVGAGLGIFLGLIIGLDSTWKVEMEIQEAYLKIDLINEVKKQTNSMKNAPIAKTVVAIENRQSPRESQNSIE